MFLAEKLKITLSASIAFDWSNALWAKPPYYTQKERTNRKIRNALSFSVGIKVIFFADAKSDISLTGSDITRYARSDILFA